MSRNDRGNILFLILLAVVLFAALASAVTSSLRGGGKNASGESAQTLATDIMNYATLVENEANRLMLVGGFNYNQIDFYNNNSHYTASSALGALKTHNTNCTALTGKQCAVFIESGGNVSSRAFNKQSNMLNYITSGHPAPGEAQFFSHYIINQGDNANPDIVMYIIDLKKAVCDAINTQIGLPIADTYASLASYNYVGERFYWNDAASGTYLAYALPGANTGYANQRTFCFKMSGYGYVFIHVLIPR